MNKTDYCSDSIKYKAAVDRYLARTGFGRLSPRAALIDMDGTLYDSMGNHADAWHRIMTEVGVTTTRDEFFLYEGRTGASTINLLFQRAFGRDATDDEIAELYHRKTVYFTEQPPVNPMPGAAEVLGFLASNGLRRVLVTGSGQSSLIGRLSEDFPGAFASADMITARDVSLGKPHPEPYIKGMELAGVEPWEAIVLENAPLGVEAGAASGAFTIGLTTGPIPAEALAEAGADLIFGSMPECAASLPRLFNAF